MHGDLPPDVLRRALHDSADLVADYLEQIEGYRVLPDIRPGAVAAQIPEAPPQDAEDVDALLRDFQTLIAPNVTHWNHPGFLAYFSSSGSAPGILGEVLAAGLSVNAMLWRTSPAATELETRVCDWLRQMIDLPEGFSGHINDTASMSTFLALAVARQRHAGFDVRHQGMTGGPGDGRLVIYASEQAHSSVDKAAIALGLGLDNVRHIACDDAFRMDPRALEAAIDRDRAEGLRPIAVVATTGTTSTTSVDPVDAIAAVCARAGIWLHVDAAWAGSGAVCPEFRTLLDGVEQADSVVVNPHKWLFVPMDCSVLFVRDVDQLRETFSIVPEYLRTAEQGEAVNLMDFGVQLGRRFRALKLWFVIRAFGVEGLRARIREHVRLGHALADWIDAEPTFERVAPVPFSTVCFRAVPPALLGDDEALDRFNASLLDAINAEGPVFLSHTALRGRYVLRLAVSNLRTEERHVRQAWTLIRERAHALATEG